MSISAIVTAIVGALFAILGFAFKHEKSKRQEAEAKVEDLKAEVSNAIVEAKGTETAQEQEREVSEGAKAINEKVEQAIKEIHEATVQKQAEIYNEKVKGWKKVKR